MQSLATLDIATRFTENPLLSAQDLKPSREGMEIESIINCGVFRYNKKLWLLVRVAERAVQTEGYINVPRYIGNGDIELVQFAKTDQDLDLSHPKVICCNGATYSKTISHLRLMCSDDGRAFYVPENYGNILAEGEHEAYGIEDCRVTEINEIFYLTYTAASAFGSGVGLMQTRDWKRFERKGMILPPHNKGCAIFEEKIRNKYYALHGTGSTSHATHVWLAESPDGIYWGKHKCIASARANMWDGAHLEAGCSPIQTPHGWLAIYKGVDEHQRCGLGALLLDINDPTVVIARSELPFMEPSEACELNASGDQSLTSNGHLVVGDKLLLYYNTGDSVICGAELSVHEIISSLTPVR